MCVGGEEEEEENYKASPLLTCSTLRESYRQVTRWGQNGRGGGAKRNPKVWMGRLCKMKIRG